MKSRMWLFQLPILAACLLGFEIVREGENGNLRSQFVRETLFQPLKSLSGKFTDLKFAARGVQQPKRKVVIVGIDEASVAEYGRWPWARDTIAALIEKVFAAGASVVGLDMFFPEPDDRVPSQLAAALRQYGLSHLVAQAQTDPVLARTIAKHRDRLVLAWMTESPCQPSITSKEECPVLNPDAIASHAKSLGHFAITGPSPAAGARADATPVMSAVTVTSNLDSLNTAARFAGFVNSWADADGVNRRTAPILLVDGVPYPSLALEVARVALNEDVAVDWNENLTIKAIRLAKSRRALPVSPLGAIDPNFRGPSFTYPYVSAAQIFEEGTSVNVGINRELASTKDSVFKDAVVLIGAAAVGLYDMRAFPFDANVPGVEGHATIVDNIISGDLIRSTASGEGRFWIFLLLSLGAAALAVGLQFLRPLAALGAFAGLILIFGYIDFVVLFRGALINWDTSFVYVEWFGVFLVAIAAKMVLEEQQKKFIYSAFGRYVSPKMVDSIVRDPSRLSLGGEKKELTILFSDIRGFTTLSEKMEARFLSRFLNQYLGAMTDIVVDENQGTLDKYIGDAIMAFWGAPLSQPDHAALACQAAVRMMKRLHELRPTFQKEFGIHVDAGIGIDSGSVSVGNMGSAKNFNYTVIGDHVNLASRLEGLTKPYGVSIVTTRQTLEQIRASGKPVPAHRVLDKVRVKGKTQVVEVIQILDHDISERALEIFEKGRELYEQMKWDDAIEKFEAADELMRPELDSSDGPCKMFIERCQTFRQTPPASDWDGSWEMTSK